MRFNLTILLIVLIASIIFPKIEDNEETDFGKFPEIHGSLLTFPSV